MANKCAAAGLGDVGATCHTDIDCGSGQRCQLAGLFSACEPQGSGDLAAFCRSNLDCFGGLYCVSGSCAPASQSAPLGGTPFLGVSCPAEVSEARAYFEVPGASDSAEGDFFRLPFPNDVRLDDAGHPQLTGFPTPGVGALGFDPVTRYVEALGAEVGFGSDPVVIFRFSAPVGESSLNASGAVRFVDLTDDASGQPTPELFYSSERTPYVCKSWLGVSRPLGAPLVPGHSYAAYLPTGLLSDAGKPFLASKNFSALLADAPPSDAALAAAYTKFAPFRSYLAAHALDPASILVASVITVGAVTDPMARLAAAVDAAKVPKSHDWVKCGATVASPCPDQSSSPGRSCAVASAYDEYQALVDLPVFQQGIAPYVDPSDGGDVVLDRPVRYEAVCLSLTVPKGSAPAQGWPLVVFAHGTGGNFRDHVRPEVAGALADAALPGGGSVGLAVLGIDQVEHGPRRGDSNQDPNNLFFNIANPAAARGNPLQGAVDQLSLAKFASNFDVTVGTDRILVDPTRVFFFGHSQGSTEGSLMLPYAPTYRAAVLSGNGASLRESLLTKTSPTDVRAVLPEVLSDATLSNDGVAHAHPVLTLLEHWIGPSDPLNFARLLAIAPVTPGSPRAVFQTYGLGDSYSPPKTLQSFILAGGFAWVENSGFTPDAIGDLTAEGAPFTSTSDGISLGFRQYRAAANSDGHFVAFDVKQANDDVVRFFALAAHGDLPAIGE